MDGICRIALEEYGCEKTENKKFGQNRMGVCRVGRQRQYLKVSNAKQKKIHSYVM
jgi:hypothetical protein